MDEIKRAFYRWLAIHYCRKALRIEEERASIQKKMYKYVEKSGYYD